MRGIPAPGDSPTTTKLDVPRTLLVTRDGSLYSFSFGGGAVGDILYKLTTDGRLEKAAGGASSGGSTPLEAASPFGVSFSTFGKRMAEGPDGSLYITDNRATLRRIAPDGRVTLVAGGGTSVEDGVSGSAVRFADVMGVAADAAGRIYVADRGGSGMRPGGRVRVIGVDGRISTVAGDGTLPLGRTPDIDVPGPAARLGQTREVVAMPDGRVLFAEAWFGTVQVLQPQRGLSLGERAVGSGDGSEMYVFDASGRHLRTVETLTGVVTWRFVWNGQGQLQALFDRNGDETQVLRDGQGRFAGFKAKDGHVLTATVDETGRVKSLVDARMRTVKVGWNAAGLPESWEDANGNAARFQYDADGRLVGDTNALGNEKRLVRESLRGGYAVSTVTPEGKTTRYEYLEDGQLRRYTNTAPDGTVTATLASGGVTSTATSNGVVVTTRLASDSRFGSQSTYPGSTSVVLPSGLTRLSTAKRTVTLATPGDVSTISRLEEESTLNGKRWLSVYTANDKTLRLTSPMGRTSTVTLDEKGRPASWTSPGVAATQVSYDSRGRATRVAQDMRRVDVTYGSNGFTDSLTDAVARTTRFSTDATGQLDSATRPDMAAYAFGWDGNGNLTSLTPPGKPAHAFGYSKVNEVTGYTPPMVAGVGNESYSWTKDSQVSSVVHPDGTSTTLTRDTAGRATRVVAPWATSTFDYSAMTGQLGSSSRDGQRLEWRYDGMLPVRESSSGLVSGSVSRRFDEDFRVVELAVNDAGVSYAYDDDGLLTAAGPVVMARSATTGQLQTATTGNITTSYTYDVYGAPASIETRVGATVVFREALTWDDIGRITAKDVAVQGTPNRWEYAYDGASRLSQARRDGQSVGVWAYDGNGNRVSADGAAATFDAQDRQLTSGAVTFGHDAFGNRTRKTEGMQTTQYVYDGVGGLLSATLPDSTRLEYIIDSRGRRVGKKRNGVLEKGWLYDGQLRIVAELDGSGAVVSRFIYGTLSHSPDIMLRSGITYRYVHDVLGSVRLVINVATGQTAQRIDYDAWGVITSDSNPGFQPFGFAGGLFDPDSRLTRFGARDYDATAGRWTSKDPIGFAGGSNVFTYVVGQPISRLDPTGLRFLGLSQAEADAINRLRTNPKIGKQIAALDDSDFYEITFKPDVVPEGGIWQDVTRGRKSASWCVRDRPWTGTLLHDLSQAQAQSKAQFGLDTTLDQFIAHELGHFQAFVDGVTSQSARNQQAVDWESAVRPPGALRPGH